MSEVYLSIGSNQGDRLMNLKKSILLISSRIGKVMKVSSVFETEPWGNSEMCLFYNIVLHVTTKMTYYNLLNEILEIEKKIGRKRNKLRYDNRLIDIDILFYDNLIISETHLIIPHPRLHLRNFVLYPLSEINDKLLHPVKHKTITELLSECYDENKVTKIDITIDDEV